MTSSDSHDASLSASKGNPGVGSAGTVELSNGNREWTEELDLFALAATALMKFDHAVKPGDGSGQLHVEVILSALVLH